MEYIKTTCKVNPDTEINREILIAELGNTGYESFAETEDSIEAYILKKNFNKDALVNLINYGFTEFRVALDSEDMPDLNWNEEWEKNYFQPLLLEERCLIRAPFHTTYPNAEYEIVIEPGMAFGTGNHETTSLMIGEILYEELDGKTVLDMGCGTGILTILASKRGAKNITSIDIDDWSIRSTKENASLNDISNIEIIHGGAEVIPDRKYDFIYANIQRNILLNDLPQYANALNTGGELVLSGFYLEDIRILEEKATKSELRLIRYKVNNEWVAAAFTF